MTEEWASSFTVAEAAHAEFARLSGDSNPLHTDAIVARRLPFGRVAVHGIHLVLVALEHLAVQDPRSPHRIRCTFRRSIGPGDQIRVSCRRLADDEVGIILEHDVWTIADLRVQLDGEPRRDPHPVDTDAPVSSTPRTPTPDEMATSDGSIAVHADLSVVHSRFPHAARSLGSQGIAELITLTRLVGMYVPGLHSMFSSFDVAFDVATESGPALRYRTRRFDDRFSKLVLDVAAGHLSGSVTAFVRPPPVEPTIKTTQPAPGAFAGQRWLVVGGSRGLGATAVMLLAAGGADVRLTYRLGSDDAARVAAAAGATAHEFDVSTPNRLNALLADGWHPTHVGYFASPPIFDGARGVYSHELERRFHAIYVDAFEAVLDRLDVDRLVGVLWPSSTAIERDTPGLAEYAAVKRLGETFCEELERRHPHLRVSAPRLPRLLTDQTTSIVPVDVDDAATTVLRALEVFSG